MSNSKNVGIEITPDIQKKLECYLGNLRDEILRRAWDACNDGSWLQSEYDLDYDPWDGKHEQKRREIEFDAVNETINLGD
jgi:hypothetical protein